MFGEFRLLFGGFEPNDTNSVLLQTPEWFLNLATYKNMLLGCFILTELWFICQEMLEKPKKRKLPISA